MRVLKKDYMSLLKVKKINETFLEIECEPSIERELAEHFCFFVPGYKFMPAYRNRMWDGKIRLFDLRVRRLYCGLYNKFAYGWSQVNIDTFKIYNIKKLKIISLY